MANLKIIWTTGRPFSPASIDKIGYQISSDEFNIYSGSFWTNQSSSMGKGYRPATAKEIEEHWDVLHSRWTPEPGDEVIVIQDYGDWENKKGIILSRHGSPDYWNVRREDGIINHFDKTCQMILAPYEETVVKPDEKSKPTIPSPKEGYVTIRFFTEEEFKSKDLWNAKGYPNGWNSDGEMNKYLGTYIQVSKSKFNGSSGFRYEDWHFGADNYEVIHEGVEPKPETTSKPGYITVRFFTEAEFKAKDKWRVSSPKNWVEPMNKYLGQTIDIKKSDIYDHGGFNHNGWTFFPNDYEVLTPEYVPKSSPKIEVKTEPKEPEVKAQRFKVGDQVTYKSKSSCDGYKYGGDDHDGYVGTITSYGVYRPEYDCYGIHVTCREGGNYSMIESEFYEYDGLYPGAVTLGTSAGAVALGTSSGTDFRVTASATTSATSLPEQTWTIQVHPPHPQPETTIKDNLAEYQQAPLLISKKPKRSLIVVDLR
jgi:hypothetical protein